ncbi:MAG: hypothetical protein R3195_16060 [Gemmatimonadota bacterium]|nr:hypothetical protein [Gemmatimonadota bacterium]
MPHLPRIRPTVLAASAAVLAAFACSEPPSATPTGPDAAAAKGGKPEKDPVVRSVTPDTAQQATTLDVVISGDNFADSSAVDWLIGGIETSEIQTNTTTFVDQRTLRANITVAEDAPTVLYDVRVTTPPGRRGTGSEKLEVKPKGGPVDLTASTEVIIPAGYDLSSDGASYMDGQDGTESTVDVGADIRIPDREFCWDLSGYSHLFPGVGAADLPFDQTGFQGCVGGTLLTRNHGLPNGFLDMDSNDPALATMLAEGPIRLDDPDDDGWTYLLVFGAVHESAPDCAQNIPGMVAGEGYLITMTSGRGGDPESGRRWTIETNPAAGVDALLWRFQVKQKGKPRNECIALYDDFALMAELVEIP